MFGIILFLLGAWLGGRSAQRQIKQLRAERDALRAMLNSKGSAASWSQTPAPASSAGVVSPHAAQTTVPAPAAQPVAPGRAMDNAIVLLYFGAFLFTAAIGLFLAIGGLSGEARSFLVALMIGVFYVGGLYLHETSRRLKPAGLTFVGIGMILVPFLGLALHSLVFNREHGPVVWFATSLLALLLYAYALIVTKHVFVSYFMIGSILSLFESGLAIGEVPVYYFTWMLALCGIFLLILSRLKGVMKELQEPFVLSSALFVPVSLLASLLFVAEHGWGQVSMALLLGVAYYATAAWYEQDQKHRIELIAVADGLAMACLGTAAYATSESIRSVSLALLLAAGVQTLTICYLGYARALEKTLLLYLSGVVACSALLGTIFVVDNAALLVTAMAVTLVMQAVLFMTTKDDGHLALGLVLWLILPMAVGWYLIDPAVSAGVMALIYAGVAAVTIGLRSLQLGYSINGLACMRLAYGLTLATAWLCAAMSGTEQGAIASILIALVAFGLSYYERAPQLVGLTGGMVYVAFAFVCSLVDTNVYEITTIGFMALSVAMYGIGELLQDVERAKALRVMGLFGAAVSALIGPLSGVSNTELSALGLMLTGGLTLRESYRAKNQPAKELSGTVMMLAFQWLLGEWGVDNFQVYTHLWAALLAGYAGWRYWLRDKAGEENYTYAALAMLTVPLMAQALGDSGQFYGWLLIAEQIGLVLIGMLIARPHVIQWGLSVAVLAVLYQLRDLTFVVLAAVGLGLIGLAVYLLNKRKDE